MTVQDVLLRAKAATATLALLSTPEKNRALAAMADAILQSRDVILTANAADLVDAAKNGMNEVMQDRLRLSPERLTALAAGMREVIALPDPCGEILSTFTRPNGLKITKIRVPLGVIAMIYESRPGVTADAAALCLKSGNVCVLRGGKEAFRSSLAIADAMRDGLARAGFSPDFVNMVPDTSRESAAVLMGAVGLVDLLIPRGGAGLINTCLSQAKVPCIQTGTGICHIYVDGDADLSEALAIIDNAKTSRPSVCNAAEVCLCARTVAPTFLPMLRTRLCDERRAKGLPPVELRLDSEAAALIPGTEASAGDFDTEFLNYILAVHVVRDVSEAITHIAAHSTHHSDAIVTENKDTASLFTAAVDSAAVYVNASTRFTDGGEFGLGCEIGISTQKLHARGPMGLRELTTYKYIVEGSGQVR